MRVSIELEDDAAGLTARVVGENEDGTFTPLAVCNGPPACVRSFLVSFVEEWIDAAELLEPTEPPDPPTDDTN
jgi:hypothetical protein